MCLPHGEGERLNMENIGGCGVASHDETCLCDVKITKPVEIKFGLTEVWHADAITQVLELGVPWSSEDAATLAESLVYAYDIWRMERVSIDRTVLRDKVLTLLGSGTSMVDVPALLDVSRDVIVRALTNGAESACWSWTEMDWLMVEGVVYDDFGKCSRSVLRSRIEELLDTTINVRLIASLSEWYSTPYNQSAQDRSNVMRGMLIEGFHPDDVVESMTAQGFDVTIDSVKSLRRRMTRDGIVDQKYPARLLPV